MTKKRYVFEVAFGGLGDHLFYSPLPRLLKQLGLADEVYLHNKSPFRNPETFDLVWKPNPFLDGVTDEAPSQYISCQSTIQRVINLEMAKHGICLKDEINPEVYAQIPVEQKYQDRSYLDLNYISFAGAFTVVDKIQLARRLRDHILVNPARHLLPFTSEPPVYTSSVFDYASLILSARSFSALTSGGASLAAGLGKPCTVYFGFGHNPVNRHSCNQHLQIGGDNLYRRWLSQRLFQRNMKRIENHLNK
jgi:hypothetical protein